MNLLGVIRKRRSIRTFKKQELSQEKTVEKLLEAARWAPSAGNVQPWEFIIASSQKTKQELSEGAFRTKKPSKKRQSSLWFALTRNVQGKAIVCTW